MTTLTVSQLIGQLADATLELGDASTIAATGTELMALVERLRQQYRDAKALEASVTIDTPRSGLDTGDARGDVGLCRGCGIESDFAYCAQCQEERAREEAASVPDGLYTITFSDGRYVTLRLRTQAPDAVFAPGKQVAGYLKGQDNESDYQGFAFVEGRQFHVWNRFRTDTSISRQKAALVVLLQGQGSVEAGLKAYAAQSGRCGICNRTLTTPESIARGIGPECAAKLGMK